MDVNKVRQKKIYDLIKLLKLNRDSYVSWSSIRKMTESDEECSRICHNINKKGIRIKIGNIIHNTF